VNQRAVSTNAAKRMKTTSSPSANLQVTLTAIAFIAMVLLVNYITWFA